MPKKIGFISTRFAGTDGVSLESAKWAEVLWQDRHISFWFSGLSDRDPACSYCVPEAHFQHPEVLWINRHLWSAAHRPRLVSERIRAMADYLKTCLQRFVEQFGSDILVAENCLAIPMHIPLGVALTEFLAESGIPAVAHHHAFFWERTRFAHSAANDYLDAAFPPRLPNLVHTVINATAQSQLARRKGVGAVLTPNVHNFDAPSPGIDDYTRDLRKDLGLAEDDILVLQPTRIVPRKGIEHAIKLVASLNDPRCKLVISHDAGDEGFEYKHIMEDLAREDGVDLRFIGERISDVRQNDAQGRRLYTLWDIYPHADLVTYPSSYEGFGNALLEAIYFRKPIVINRYSIFIEDIEPKGFRLARMDGYVSPETVREVRALLERPDYRQEVADHNFAIARRYYGYPVLKRSLRGILTQLTGWQNPGIGK